jgi:hypothetical protein
MESGSGNAAAVRNVWVSIKAMIANRCAVSYGGGGSSRSFHTVRTTSAYPAAGRPRIGGRNATAVNAGRLKERLVGSITNAAWIGYSNTGKKLIVLLCESFSSNTI